jgi:CRISPR-associated protein Cas1
MPQDLHVLPKLRDSLSYLFVEHVVVDRNQHAIELIRKEGRTLVPIAALCLLMLGPGTSITHAAIKLLAESGCTVLWTGEEGIRFYAQGGGETRKSYHILRQVELACNPEARTQVVLRMYLKRFNEQLDSSLTLPQIRGLEGVRMRTAYAHASKQYGVPWQGRIYDRRDWNKADPINRALSAANALLNGICHSAIVAGGYSPAIGFIHTGRQTSFVYDIADLYKTGITIPIAFQMVSESTISIDKRVRQACREKFYEVKLLERLLPDIDELLGISGEEAPQEAEDADADGAVPGPLWEELLEEPEETTWS